MRRFSQRNSLVTLNDINITPLLDLAFVLLIIFVIISPSIRSAHEQSIQLNLPKGGQADRKVDPKDVVMVEISLQGTYVFKGRPIPLKQLESTLIKAARANPDLIVYLRADRKSLLEQSASILDLCQKHRIAISLETEPE